MATKVTLLDGGMGRELLRIGAPFRQPEWSALALLEGPDWVVQAHRNFIDAGAEVITTNSYALVPFHIGEDLFAQRGGELAALSGRLAREAATGNVLVAGSLPPLFGSYRPDLFDRADAPRIIDPLIAGLAEYVDVWLAETMSSIDEAVAVREALDRAGATQPLWVSYSLADGASGALRSGESVADAVSTALDLGASAVLFNCCAAESITVAIKTAVGLVGPNVAVGGYANRFVESHTESGGANEQVSKLRNDLDPTGYAALVAEWIEQGATMVGGCCGIEPEHIAALAQLLAQRASQIVR
jgi:S-methylmethionine-dependent homocysteine/selenocysteine methylase